MEQAADESSLKNSPAILIKNFPFNYRIIFFSRHLQPEPGSFLGRFPCGWTSLSGIPAFFFFSIRDSEESSGNDEKKENRAYILEMAVLWDLRGCWKQKQLETMWTTPADRFPAGPDGESLPSCLCCSSPLSVILDDTKILAPTWPSLCQKCFSSSQHTCLTRLTRLIPSTSDFS